MGKPTGFLEFQRLSEAYAPVDERLKNYKEFVVTLSSDDASKQAARCMDCVAFIRRFEDDYKFRPRYLIENYRSTRHMINACTK